MNKLVTIEFGIQISLWRGNESLATSEKSSWDLTLRIIEIFCIIYKYCYKNFLAELASQRGMLGQLKCVC